MSWIKLDDQWMDHPKVIEAGRDARDMWLASITWCAKHLTDGKFSANLLPSLAVAAGVDVANCQTFASVLVGVGLWDATQDGYSVHDYLDYNPSKEQALATREARKEAGRAGGIAKASKMPSKNVPNVCPVPVPVSPTPTSELNNKDILTGFQQLFHLPIDSVDILTEFEDMEKQYPQRFWKVMQWASNTKPKPSSAKRVLKMVGAAIANWKDEFPKNGSGSNGSGEKIPGVNGKWLTDAGTNELCWVPF